MMLNLFLLLLFEWGCICLALKTYTITGYAGTGTASYTGDNGAASAATLSYPVDVSLDTSSNLFIVLQGAHCIKKIDLTAKITTYLGSCGSGGYTEGTPSNARFTNLNGLYIDSQSKMYIADSGSNRIRMFDPDSLTGVFTYCGGGTLTEDGIASTAALVYGPHSVWVNTVGILVYSEAYHRIRILQNGLVYTIAGSI